MIRTGDEYRASLQDGREIYISGGRIQTRAQPGAVASAAKA